jgi:hypothetical protein
MLAPGSIITRIDDTELHDGVDNWSSYLLDRKDGHEDPYGRLGWCVERLWFTCQLPGSRPVFRVQTGLAQADDTALTDSFPASVL